MAAKSLAQKDKIFTIALVGNPNAGKTSIFNNLTGSRQHVGNWPGVTVEIKEGSITYQGRRIKVVDLPGTYSLGAYSEDELIARDFIIRERPDAVINVIDGTNLERNLYLTVQLLELGLNVVVALNMFDEVQSLGLQVDHLRLAQLLGVPVVPTVGTRGEGSRALVEAAAAVPPGRLEHFRIDYGKELEAELASLERLLSRQGGFPDTLKRRWLALKLIEEDEAVVKMLRQSPGGSSLLQAAAAGRERINRKLGDDVDTIVAGRRYRYLGDIAGQCLVKPAGGTPVSLSDRIDAIATHRYLGLPLFLLAMGAVFQLSFTLAGPLADGIAEGFAWLAESAAAMIVSLNAPPVLSSLVSGGIIAGVGAVLVFVPNIFLLFMAISLLEDSGYMARAAFIMDRFMHSLGLHGRSFIPLLLGFGCNVPAIMATRTLENRKDRLLTILINPLMSCSARLPVYVLFVGAFFSAYQGLVILSLYLLGILLAVLMGRLFKTFLFPGDTSPFVMELPPYRLPTLKGLSIHMWERGGGFLRRAGTIIVCASVVIWALSNLPWGADFASPQSYLGRIGGLFAPLLKPAGFGQWEAAAALIFGLLAKEIVVSTLAVVYGAAETGLTGAITAYWTPLSAYAFMVMTLIYIPCVATVATIRKETNSWSWTGFAVGYSLALGWVMAVIVYQIGLLLGWG